MAYPHTSWHDNRTRSSLKKLGCLTHAFSSQPGTRRWGEGGWVGRNNLVKHYLDIRFPFVPSRPLFPHQKQNQSRTHSGTTNRRRLTSACRSSTIVSRRKRTTSTTSRGAGAAARSGRRSRRWTLRSRGKRTPNGRR